MGKRDKAKFWNQERVYQLVLYTIVSLLLLICIYPLIYVLSASFMSQQEWTATNGLFLFPKHPTLDAYRVVLVQTDLYRAFGVSVLRTVCGSLLSVSVCAVTGYALSRKDLVGKRVLSVILFVTMIYTGGMIPGYLVIESMGLLNTFWVYVIPGMLSAWTALVFRQTFLATPLEIEESAKVDGASDFLIMLRIMIPINMPTVAVMLLFAAVGHWNSWFDAMLYIETGNKALMPLQLFLQNAFASGDNTTTFTPLNSETQKMVVAVVGIVPILCVYPFFQKYFTKGVYMGAVKG